VTKYGKRKYMKTKGKGRNVKKGAERWRGKTKRKWKKRRKRKKIRGK